MSNPPAVEVGHKISEIPGSDNYRNTCVRQLVKRPGQTISEKVGERRVKYSVWLDALYKLPLTKRFWLIPATNARFPAVLIRSSMIGYQLVAQLIHIKAVQPGGERFNSLLSEEMVNGYANLMFLCYRHHVETNDVAIYDVQTLYQMKRDHESRFLHTPSVVDMAHVFHLKQQTESYWRQVEYSHLNQHISQEFERPFNVNSQADSALLEFDITSRNIATRTLRNLWVPEDPGLISQCANNVFASLNGRTGLYCTVYSKECRCPAQSRSFYPQCRPSPTAD